MTGPRTLPWGTPELTLFQSDVTPSITTMKFHINQVFEGVFYEQLIKGLGEIHYDKIYLTSFLHFWCYFMYEGD